MFDNDLNAYAIGGVCSKFGSASYTITEGIIGERYVTVPIERWTSLIQERGYKYHIITPPNWLKQRLWIIQRTI